LPPPTAAANQKKAAITAVYKINASGTRVAFEAVGIRPVRAKTPSAAKKA